MTSEVVVMNRLAVALAADSAVTASQKIHNSANKLFMLSETEPVGIMVYNNASLMSVPWETLIKDFRAGLNTRHAKLEQYGDAFLAYLNGKMHLFDISVQKRYFLDLVEHYFRQVAKNIRKALDEAQSGWAPTLDAKGVEAKRQQIYSETIAAFVKPWKEAPRTTSLADNAGSDMASACSPDIHKLITDIIKVPHPQLGNPEVSALRQFAIDLVESEMIAPTSLSGVVIAGFGTADFFPVLQVFEVGDAYGNKLKSPTEN